METFTRNFGDKCLTLDQIFSVCYDTAQDNSDESDSSEDTENAPAQNAENLNYLQGKKELIGTILVCGCNCLIAERCSAATFATLMGKKSEQTHFFNLGNY